MSDVTAATSERPRPDEGGSKAPPGVPGEWRPIADKIVLQCLGVTPGEVVQLGGGVHNFDFVGALAAAVRRAGAFAELNVTSDDLQLETLLTVPEEHLRAVPPHRLRWLEDIDAMIVTDAVSNPGRAEAVPRERRIAAHAAAETVERHLFERGLRWVYVGYPTPANCVGLPVPFDELRTVFWRAVDVDYDVLAAEGAFVADKLENGNEVRITTVSGTELSFLLGHRPILVDDGVISARDVEEGNAAVHLPAGRVLAAPLETSAEGRIVIDRAWQDGRSFQGVVLQLEDGRVRVEGEGKAADELRRRLENGRGDKDRLGVFSVGLNPAVDRFSGYAALDEKRRGSVHLSLGDNRLFGGENVSNFHFDLFLESVTLSVDGTNLFEGGRLVGA